MLDRIKNLYVTIFTRFMSYSLTIRIAICTVVVSLFLFCGSTYILYCNDGYIRTDLIGISSKAQGYISKIYIKNNQQVKKGDRLIEIDPTPYQLARNSIMAQIEEAKAVLDFAVQGKQSAIDNKEAIEAQATLANTTLNRYKGLEPGAIVSMQKIDDLTGQLQTLKANIEKADVMIKQAMILINQQAASIKVLESQLAISDYQLSLTTLLAPTDGIINNMEIAVGDYVEEGSVLFGLLDQKKWRVIANYKQSDLSHVYVGKKVFLYLPNFQWHIWTGRVVATGHAVARNQDSSNSALPYIEPITDWIRYPYRFPVYIELDKTPPVDKLHMGMDVYCLIIP